MVAIVMFRVSACHGRVGDDLDPGVNCFREPNLPCDVYAVDDDWTPADPDCPEYLFAGYKGPVLHPCSLPDVEVS